MINAIVTGSQKYGYPTNRSDIDVVIFCSRQTERTIWSRAYEVDENAKKCMFWQVGFPQVPGDVATVEFGIDVDVEAYKRHTSGIAPSEPLRGVDVNCLMDGDDLALLKGLHQWLPAADGRGFSSTLRNDRVNLVPVFDPEIWDIWRQGTAALVAMARQGVDCNRDFAIKTFTAFGLPRMEDS